MRLEGSQSRQALVNDVFWNCGHAGYADLMKVL